VTNPYKQRMRQLGYNLRDPLNTALRQHVLSGAITPGRLVTMSAADLANKEMAEFRRKVEEEHNRSIELDVDTAAKVGVGGWRVLRWHPPSLGSPL
jgi:hypothetical protein